MSDFQKFKGPYILATPESLAAAPEVQALIADVVAKERERCAKQCDRIAGNTKDFSAETRRAAGMCASTIRANASEPRAVNPIPCRPGV